MRHALPVLIAATIAQTTSAEMTVEWSVDLKAPAHAPTLYPNTSRPTGVIITTGSDVVRIDGKGKVVWTTPLPERLCTPATVADLDADGDAEILVGLLDGTVVCLAGDGHRKWLYQAKPPPWEGFEMITCADVLTEPGLEVLFGYEDGWVGCLNAQGKLRWRFHGDRFRTSPLAVGDTDGDGAPEIIYGTDNGHVYCLTGWGAVKWRYSELAPYGRSGPNLADLDGDGRPETLITRSNTGIATCLMALDAGTGAFRWRTRDIMQGYVSNAIVDLDGDGKLDTLHADKGNHVYCTRADGTQRWRADLGGRGIFWAPAVADIDGDGRLEVIVGVRGVDPETKACAYVLADDGAIEQRLELGGSANTAPAVADVDGDGELEILIATEGPAKLRSLTWHGKGRVAWPCLRGDSAMTAATRVSPGKPVRAVDSPECGQVRIEAETCTWGENVWRLAWAKPVGEDAYVEVSVAVEKGIRQTRIIDLMPGATSARADWQLVGPGNAQVSVRLLDPSSPQPRFVARRGVTPKPPEFCDLATVEAACRSAIDQARPAKEDARALATRLTSLEVARESVARLAAAAAPSQEIARSATDLRKQADGLRATAIALAAFWRDGGKGDFVFWQDANPWDRFDPSAVPTRLESTTSLRVWAYQDEFEDVALTLLNITADPIDVRCTFVKPSLGSQRTPEPPKLAHHITLRRALRTPSRLGGMRNDALPELDRSGVITLAPGEARQVWLVIDSHGLSPGTHKLSLHLGTLSETPTFREVPIEIEVWPIALPKVYAQINWSRADAGVVPDQVLRDMLDHGVNVLYGPSATVPVDAKGKSAGAVDWKQFDATLARLPSHAQVLFPAPPARRWPHGVSPKDRTPLWETGFKAAVRVLAAHMKSLGWGYDRWAFYPVDEPWLTGDTQLPHLRRFCETVKSADPKARIYADPAGFVRVEGVSKFADLIDIWQPEMNLLKRDPKLVDWFHKNARTFWAYEAPGPSKDLLPLGHYRAFAWLAWKYGTVGAGYWVYRDLDLWWPVPSGDYGAVYPADRHVVPSRRWEASRDGVEDYRALHVLAEEIAKARRAGLTEEANNAQRLIDDAVEAMVGWHARNIDEITRMTRDHELDFGRLTNVRQKIARAILDLRGGAGTGASTSTQSMGRRRHRS
ncbi:MAG: VCBS repeat-containing protein [Phycisphaerae bacterium]|nr:VCBS repeat-containing protein [Phycisphaerae bacterium]